MDSGVLRGVDSPFGAPLRPTVFERWFWGDSEEAAIARTKTGNTRVYNRLWNRAARCGLVTIPCYLRNR